MFCQVIFREVVMTAQIISGSEVSSQIKKKGE
ncbi:Uncharacterised protein [Mannheimia haemolytica]|uniref:Uncharacterized protein n=1 Tax=Mannheimia haemolytica TaxID=75985 RepID=A0A378N975_MANHA|nr:Uncharacterised protein [Mannheimia haemolytica]